MTDEAVIQGSLVDVRNVNQHKCVRMLIDVPAEKAPKVMEAFGWPTMVAPVSVVVARLAPSPLKEALQRSVEAEREKDKEPREWSTISRSQQSGIACSDPGFRQFIASKGYVVTDAETAATAVRQICGVNSRRHFADNPEAGARWDRLYGEFQMARAGATS